MGYRVKQKAGACLKDGWCRPIRRCSRVIATRNFSVRKQEHENHYLHGVRTLSICKSRPYFACVMIGTKEFLQDAKEPLITEVHRQYLRLSLKINIAVVFIRPLVPEATVVTDLNFVPKLISFFIDTQHRNY